MNLSKEQRVEIYEYAACMYRNYVQFGKRLGICRLLTLTMHDMCYVSSAILKVSHSSFPELDMVKPDIPRGIDTGYWWPLRDTEPRFKALERMIKLAKNE